MSNGGNPGGDELVGPLRGPLRTVRWDQAACAPEAQSKSDVENPVVGRARQRLPHHKITWGNFASCARASSHSSSVSC